MGLLDKVGTAFKNTDSKIGQSIEESKINGKINEELHKTNKNYGALGELYYARPRARRRTSTRIRGRSAPR